MRLFPCLPCISESLSLNSFIFFHFRMLSSLVSSLLESREERGSWKRLLTWEKVCVWKEVGGFTGRSAGLREIRRGWEVTRALPSFSRQFQNLRTNKIRICVRKCQKIQEDTCHAYFHQEGKKSLVIKIVTLWVLCKSANGMNLKYICIFYKIAI